jgi:nucleoside 2-deoxyribosyltransferase
MVKAYVAGKFEEKPAVKELMSDLLEMGVGITHDWTPTDSRIDGKKTCAVNDAHGAASADFVVIVATKRLNYAGSYVEFGIALGKDKPVYVIGNGMDRCLFVNHPTVIKFSNKNDFLDYVKSNY